ncbi:hypothetical protein JTB14_032235 [Gonioctena quinquepunctata]|nr:hypothetical protein JTB14_032235 [Gonioctena quinquepunctata]
MLVFALFAICAVLSYPMAGMFNYEPLWILFVGPYSQKPLYQLAHMCVASKQRLMIYYIAMAALIFLPIVSIFIWFYFKIAVLIWKHRKPFSARFTNKCENKIDSEDASSSTTKTTTLTSSISSSRPPMKKGRNIHVERKIRTFRIVLVLMVSFAFCRLPYWCYYILRLVGTQTSETSWNVNFTLIALNLLNCALNPLLYTFLNETINVIKMINDFMCKVCCCCFSNDEFDPFERENAFPRETHDSGKILNNKAVKFGNVQCFEKTTNNLSRY